MRWTRIVAMLVVVSMLSACVSYQPIGIQTSSGGDVQLSAPIVPGDRVRIVRKSGEVSTFRVVVVEEERISSDTMTYEFDDIESIEVQRASDERTTLILVIGIIVIASAFALANEVEEGIECIFGC